MPFRYAMLAAIFLSCAPAQTTPAPLTALNDAFRAAYAEAKRRVLASAGPTLLVNGDTFILTRDGRRVEANTATPIYDPVKTIAHIPLAIYVTLTPGRRSARRRPPDHTGASARTRSARRSQSGYAETRARHTGSPEADRVRMPGFHG